MANTLKCKICSIEVERRSNGQKYCPECFKEKQRLRSAEKNKIKRPKKRKCLHCGTEYDYEVRKRFCSEDCRLERRRERDRKNAERQRRKKGIKKVKGTTDKCHRCRQSYTKMIVHGRYCKPCRVEVSRENARDRIVYREWGNGNTCQCTRCGRSFIKDYPRRIYCESCRNLPSNQLYPEWYEKFKVEWRDRYRDRERVLQKRWRAKQRETNPVFVLKERVRANIRAALEKHGYSKGTKTEQILGCSWDHFKTHIERQFLPGMTWENRDRWHIDHIVPLASAETEADVIALNHYTNLRPLWAEDNLAKRDQMVYLI